MNENKRLIGPRFTGPPPIGHNNGPREDAGKLWTAHCWRKAHKKMWKNPPIETVRRRTRNAKRLGLTYRQYTSVILDRGHHMKAGCFILEDILQSTAQQRKLVALDCPIFLVGQHCAGAEEKLREFRASSSVPITDGALFDLAGEAHGIKTKRNTAGLIELLQPYHISPSQAFLVGDSQSARVFAQITGLAKFIWSANYFEMA